MCAWCMCVLGVHVCLVYMCAWCTCVLGVHVCLVYMCAWCTCVLGAHVYLVYMCAWCTCVLGVHVQAWPDDALQMVANKFLEDVEMEDTMRVQCVFMCQHFHQSVRLLSEKFYATLRRRNYVTPTSYLELILTFKSLLSKKREELTTMRQRYLTGLEKLQFAASQVRPPLPPPFNGAGMLGLG